MNGGKAGTIQKYIDLNEAIPLGAGNFGIVLATKGTTTKDTTTKLFYDTQSCNKIHIEARIQQKARNILKGIVKVPKIYDVYNIPITYKNKTHLCGITMDRVPIPEGFDIKKHGIVHILLGYDQYDLNTAWSKDFINPISDENPTRGFHMGPDMLEEILEEDGIHLTIEEIAYKMGLSLSLLIKNNIIPLDLEWIYGGDGEIYLIDFGLCEEGIVRNKMEFLKKRASDCLGVSYYIPKQGMRGYTEFLKGYMS
jgi:hypothetical protein